MALSGSQDFKLSARQVVTHALKRAGVTDIYGSPAPEEASLALTELEMMLKGWQIKGPNLLLKREATLSLTQGTESYTLDADTLRVLSCRSSLNGNEIPMAEMTREEYFDLPTKSTTGYPTQYYFDPQLGAPTLYVWPTASSDNYIIKYTKQKRIDDIDNLNNDLEISPEFFETVVTCLASRISDFYGKDDQKLTAIAMKLESEARDFSREPFVQFVSGS